MNALERWNQTIGSPGLFLNQSDSQKVLTMGQGLAELLPAFPSKPNPSYVAVKFGGDWGGLWGNPDVWGKLKSEYPHGIVIPYIYCLPEHWASYRDIVGGLIHDGYPAVILDIEMEWEGSESVLYQMLTQLNLDQNLIAVCGFGWFNGWPNGGKDFIKVMQTLDVVYLPMLYESGEKAITDYHWVSELFPNKVIPLLSEQAIAGNHRFDTEYAVWELSSIRQSDWTDYAVAEPTPQPEPVKVVTVAEEMNTALGQALLYAETIITEMQGWDTTETNTNIVNQVNAIERCIHTARKLNGGE